MMISHGIVNIVKSRDYVDRILYQQESRYKTLNRRIAFSRMTRNHYL